MSEVNNLANKASKLSTGARVVTDPYGPEFWPRYQIPRFSGKVGQLALMNLQPELFLGKVRL